MNLIKIKNIAIIAASTIATFSIFIIFDLFFGSKIEALLSPNTPSLIKRPYQEHSNGWYELKKDFTGEDQWGEVFFTVETDAYGFRKRPGFTTDKKNNVIFLGDSFTYGINGKWEETFVGMFESETSLRVLNAGVSSYSPTPYLYQYLKALNSNALASEHIVIVGIDISDVQDEAGHWKWNEETEEHPSKMFAVAENDIDLANIRSVLRKSLPLTVAIYRKIRYGFQQNTERNLISLPRSAFTWSDWSLLDQTTPLEYPDGYAPLGVTGGLKKIDQRISQIINLASNSNSKVYLLIYPWPAQIAFKDNFDWSGWIKGLCTKNNCAGVVDATPRFRELALNNESWLMDYFVKGDIHYNKAGNRIISDLLVENIELK